MRPIPAGSTNAEGKKERKSAMGMAETVNLRHIEEHYYRSHESINPTRIVPKGPPLDFTTPHGRERL
jgi:glutathionyl-hydroquinone reductase